VSKALIIIVATIVVIAIVWPLKNYFKDKNK